MTSPPEDAGRGPIDAVILQLTQEFEGRVRGVLEGLARAAVVEREAAAADVERVRAEGTEARGRAEAEVTERFTRELERTRESERRTAIELEHVREAERRALAGGAERLLPAIKGLDVGRSLSDILDSLHVALEAEASRVAILIVEDTRFRGWRVTGFEPDATAALMRDQSVVGSGIVARVVERRDTCVAKPGGFADPVADLPFAPLADGRSGVAVPISVGDRVALVVYADDGKDAGSAAAVFRPAAVELLVRHASRCLEAQTAVRTSEAVSLMAHR